MAARRPVATGLVATMLALAALLCPGTAAAQTFYPDDPLDREPPPLPAVDPGRRNLSALLETVSATFGSPGERQPDNGVIAARGVNTLGEVPDGPWFVNRHGRTRLSAAELRRGSGDAHPPSLAGPWKVLVLRSYASRPGLVVRDVNGETYLLHFDLANAPEMATGAALITSRFFYAIGYHVSDSYLVTFSRDQLAIAENASGITSMGELRTLEPDDIDRLLARVSRRSDGRYRASALRVPSEALSLIGPFQFYGTRSDDPNDIVRHEHRRDLRGLQVFAAWLNHTRIDAIHTADAVVQPPGEAPHVRHYLFDFMAALGSGITGPKAAWQGHERVWDGSAQALKNMAGLGIYTPAWMRAKYPGLTAVGSFDAETFDPEKWTPVYDLAAFDNRLPDDTFWAAKQVMAFTDDDIRTIVDVAEYSDPRAARWIADCLIARRDKIGRTYFAQVLPLDGFAVRDGVLVYTDLAVHYGFAAPRPYRVDWWTYDNKAGKPLDRIGAEGARVPSEAIAAPDRSYVLARIASSDDNTTVRVWLRREGAGLRVVGIDRDWPGRKLVDPRKVVQPVANRYAELEPQRRALFDEYAGELNTKSPVSLPPEERFRTLSLSQQTTFDAITHALLHSPLTDDRGAPLGTALELVTGIDRIAGQQAGRGGDQQFRLYARLRPDARDTLERSREFVRTHENTVYHAGYPHSYRLGTKDPSVQFSLADDGLSADIDVDYRTSKAPQALFNGHLTSANSDVRAGDNAKRHSRRWTGFIDWWSDLFGSVPFGQREAETEGPFDTPPTRIDVPLPPNRPLGASIPVLADAVQEFLTDWVIRRNYREALAFVAPEALACVADSVGKSPSAPPDELRKAALHLLETSAKQWGRPRTLAEAMNPVLPWSPAVHIVKHTFDRDFTIVDAPTELGALYECGATPPKNFRPSATPEYGKYFGAILQTVRDGQAGGAVVFVWRQIAGEWKLVAYRSVE